MNFQLIGYLSILLSTFFIFFQLIFLPVILQQFNLKNGSILKRLNSIKDSDSFLTSSLLHIQRSKRSVQCLPGLPGPQGPEGADGESGQDGDQGERGLDARDILENEVEQCIVCPTGPAGPIGPPGDRGESGLPGDKGSAGMPADDGVDGEQGIEGEMGPSGFPGPNGDAGTSGKNAFGGTGLPGPKGAPGPVGRAGLQGPRGTRNYIYGQSGPPGQPGPNGLDGISGKQGDRGHKGIHGERGANAKFCPCPIELQLLSEKKNGKPGAHSATQENIDRSGEREKSVGLVEPSSGPIRSPGYRTTNELSAPPGTTSRDLSVAVVSSTVAPTTVSHKNTDSSTENISRGLNLSEQQVVLEEVIDEPAEIIETADTPPPFGNDQQTLVEDDYAEQGDDLEEVITTKRRFIYVTKKPLPLWN